MFVVRTYLRVSNIIDIYVNRTVVCDYNTQSIRKAPNIICLFNLHAEYIMQNAGLDQAQAGIKIAGRNINNLDMQTTPPYGRKQRGTKEPVDEEERGE